MSAKSNPGDGTHGKGVKGGRTDGGAGGPLAFLRDLVCGLRRLRRG